MDKNFTVLVDMDGVLVDFTSGAAYAHGLTPEVLREARLKYAPETWDMLKPLGFAKGYKRDLTLEEFWEPIHAAGEDFWTSLKPSACHVGLCHTFAMDYGCREYATHILSAPSMLVESYTGKVKWLKKYFGKDFNRFAITPHKALFARDNTILVDDRQRNCNDFVAAGGHAILFPAIGNRLYHYADNPMPYVRHQLSVLKGTVCT